MCSQLAWPKKNTNLLLPCGQRCGGQYCVQPCNRVGCPSCLCPAGVLASAAPAAGQPHPVWGSSTPDVAKYIRLLQYLCGEELMRLRVWTDPLKHADSSRTVPVVRRTVLSRLCGLCGPATEAPQEAHGLGSKVAWAVVLHACCTLLLAGSCCMATGQCYMTTNMHMEQ